MELQVGVKILLKNREGNYLLLLRSLDKYPGAIPMWDIPGGRINPGTSLIENLKREVIEEAGLKITSEPKFIAAQDIFVNEINRHVVRLTYTGLGGGNVKLSEEHTDFKWLTLEEILKLDPLDSYLKEVLSKFSI